MQRKSSYFLTQEQAGSVRVRHCWTPCAWQLHRYALAFVCDGKRGSRAGLWKQADFFSLPGVSKKRSSSCETTASTVLSDRNSSRPMACAARIPNQTCRGRGEERTRKCLRQTLSERQSLPTTPEKSSSFSSLHIATLRFPSQWCFRHPRSFQQLYVQLGAYLHLAQPLLNSRKIFAGKAARNAAFSSPDTRWPWLSSFLRHPSLAVLSAWPPSASGGSGRQPAWAWTSSLLVSSLQVF